MKILHLVYEDCGAPTGGMGVHCQELLPRLAEHHNVVAVDYDQHRQLGGFYEGAWKNQPRAVLTRDEFVSSDASFRVLTVFPTADFDSHMHPCIQRTLVEHQFLRNTLSHLRDYEPDIIHVHDCHLWRVAEDLRCLWPAAKTVLTVHLSGLISAPWLAKYIVPRYGMQTELTAFCDADAVIAVSDFYRDRVAELSRRDDVYSIKNAVDSSFLASIEYKQEVRNKYPADKKLVQFIGRLTPQKGIEHIINAAEALPEYYFLIISHYHPMQGCPTVARLREAIDRLPNLQWDEQIDFGMEKWETMKVADIAIVPSNFEPFGIVALEWMALGVPLVTSGVDGLGEFCNNDNAIVDENLIRALHNYQQNDKRTECARLTACAHSWDDVAMRVLNVYEGVMK